MEGYRHMATLTQNINIYTLSSGSSFGRSGLEMTNYGTARMGRLYTKLTSMNLVLCVETTLHGRNIVSKATRAPSILGSACRRSRVVHNGASVKCRSLKLGLGLIPVELDAKVFADVFGQEGAPLYSPITPSTTRPARCHVLFPSYVPTH